MNSDEGMRTPVLLVAHRSNVARNAHIARMMLSRHGKIVLKGLEGAVVVAMDTALTLQEGCAGPRYSENVSGPDDDGGKGDASGASESDGDADTDTDADGDGDGDGDGDRGPASQRHSGKVVVECVHTSLEQVTSRVTGNAKSRAMIAVTLVLSPFGGVEVATAAGAASSSVAEGGEGVGGKRRQRADNGGTHLQQQQQQKQQGRGRGKKAKLGHSDSSST